MKTIQYTPIEKDYDRSSEVELYKILFDVSKKIKKDMVNFSYIQKFESMRRDMDDVLEKAVGHAISNFELFSSEYDKYIKDIKSGNRSSFLINELERQISDAANFIREIRSKQDDKKVSPQLRSFYSDIASTLQHLDVVNDSFVRRLAVFTDRELSSLSSIDTLEPQHKLQKNNNKQKNPVIIRHIALNQGEFALIINHGEIYIPFTSKKSGTGLAKEKKQFKALVHFWEFRWEKNREGKILLKGEVVTRDNLKRSTDAPSDNAALNYIARLNDIFHQYNVPIEIEGGNKSYKLVITRG